MMLWAVDDVDNSDADVCVDVKKTKLDLFNLFIPRLSKTMYYKNKLCYGRGLIASGIHWWH